MILIRECCSFLHIHQESLKKKIRKLLSNNKYIQTNMNMNTKTTLALKKMMKQTSKKMKAKKSNNT